MIGFGEIALLMNDKRTASIVAQNDCECWVLSADVFKNIIAQNTLRRRGLNMGYMNQVQLFKNLETYEKLKLIDGLKSQEYSPGQFVFNQGDIGNEFFIIESGQCECLKPTPDSEDGFEQVRLLTEGSHFGEVAILKNVTRTLAVRAVDNLKLLVLSREAFQRILGSIKDFLMEDY